MKTPPHIDDDRLAGVPSEMRPRLVAVIAAEPEHTAQDFAFERRAARTRRFNLRELLRPARGSIAIALFLVAAESMLLQVGPLMVQRAIDQGIVPKNFRAVFIAASVYLASVILGGVATSLRIWFTGRLGQRLMKALRVRVFTHFQRLSQAYFTDERVGRLLTRMTSDIEAMTELLQDGIINLLVQGFTLVVVTVVMLTLDVRLALIILGAVVPAMIALTFWFRNASEKAYGTVRVRIAEVLADLAENLSGARVATATNRQPMNEQLHRKTLGRHRDAQVHSGNIQGFYGPTVQTLGRFGQVIVIAVGGTMVLDGQLTIGELTAFVLYLASFFAPIQELVNLYNSYQSGQAAVGKIADLLDEVPSVQDPLDPRPLLEVRGALRFDHVSFGYLPGVPILRDIDLHIHEGETVAFVGETGAGKSTLAKLVTRTYDPDEGAVLLDGVDLRELSLTSLRSVIGVVPQEPFLFSGTLRDNLTLGRPQAPDSYVDEVARSLGLGQLLDRMGGLDGRVAERGIGLSSGERQLVALARALVPEPRLLLLDEATSNLDLESERVVERALDVALHGRTAILVAHRLSTAERADRVVVTDAGRIIEVGSHPELVAGGGHYARMFRTWTESHG